MAIPILMPSLSPTMTEGSLAKWCKNVGDEVKVKLIGVDDRGKVKLSMKMVNQETGEEITS